MRLQKEAPAQEARDGQRLLMGPWAHAATSPEGKIGDVTFGSQAVLDMNATIVKWYDFAIKGKQNEFATEAPVKIFVMGDNVWRAEKEFPLARTRYTKYYLHAGTGARSVAGDGVISTAAPQKEKPDTVRIRSGKPRADDWRQALLRWHAAGPVRSAPERVTHRCAGLLDAAART